MPKPRNPTDMLLLKIWEAVCMARVSFPDAEAMLILAVAAVMQVEPALAIAYYSAAVVSAGD